MKRILLTIIIGLCCCLTADLLHAQEQQGSLRERIARRQAEQDGRSAASKRITVRSQIMDESLNQEIGNPVWMREIYSFLDMENEKNAALYYPVQPIADRINFFTLIFKAILDGDVDVYEYLIDGSPRFTPEYKMKIDSSFFYKLDIPFDIKNGKYIVDPSSVPSEDVRGYYIKELWYFDKENSVVSTKTIAVCPVMMYQEYDNSGLSRFPLFWIPYESIRPYASEVPIMTSNLNNALTMTINDFFINRNFNGEIYKTANMMNKTLAEQFEGDSLKKEQKKIENELKTFNEKLWVYNDSVAIANRAKAKTKSSKKSGKTTNVSEDEESVSTAEKVTVQKSIKRQRSTPVRSMRNRKRN